MGLVRTTLILIACAAAGEALAQEDRTAARDTFNEATRFYNLSEYREALAGFKRAYLLYESPEFLFNIAQCHRALGNKSEALQFYRAFLRTSTFAKPQERTVVRQLITQLEVALAAEAAARNAPPAGTTPTPPPVETRDARETPPVAATPATATPVLIAPAPPPAARRPLYKRWWVWTLAGAATVAVAVGVGVGVGRPAAGFQSTLHDFGGGRTGLAVGQ